MSVDLVMGLVSVLGMALVALTAYAIKYLSNKTDLIKDASTKELLQKVVTIAGQKVLAAEQTVVNGLKEDVASGKLTKDGAKGALMDLKEQTVKAVLQDSNAMGIWKDVQAVFGGDHTAAVKWVSDLIESQVAQLPPSGLGTQTTVVVPAVEAPKV